MPTQADEKSIGKLIRDLQMSMNWTTNLIQSILQVTEENNKAAIEQFEADLANAKAELKDEQRRHGVTQKQLSDLQAQFEHAGRFFAPFASNREQHSDDASKSGSRGVKRDAQGRWNTGN